MITFVCWKWRRQTGLTEYVTAHVNALFTMLRQYHRAPFRLICVTDDPEGIECETFPLWTDHMHLPNVTGPQLPSCYRRLRLFDPATQKSMGISPGERVVSIDLDVLVMADIVHLFERPEPFVGIVVKGYSRRQVINGSMFMFTAGEFEQLWVGFDARTSPRSALSAGYLGSDQGWLSYQLAGQIGKSVGAWTAREHRVLCYWRDIKPSRVLPADARIVFFPGSEKHWDANMRRRNSWIDRVTEQHHAYESSRRRESEQVHEPLCVPLREEGPRPEAGGRDLL